MSSPKRCAFLPVILILFNLLLSEHVDAHIISYNALVKIGENDDNDD